jgi:hypothetical protein
MPSARPQAVNANQKPPGPKPSPSQAISPKPMPESVVKTMMEGAGCI